jgi:hypothetical protein
MKERPILFNGEMVRAILEGRKTQTRRIVATRGVDPYTKGIHSRSDISPKVSDCYIKEGDLLWVRESHCPLMSIGGNQRKCKAKDAERVLFKDGASLYKDGEYFQGLDEYSPDALWPKWSPSIHMPRWASRITLKVTSVRVERLNHISDDDCEREGIEMPFIAERRGELAQGRFRNLWESVYGEGSWSANPWVWVIEFEVQAR